MYTCSKDAVAIRMIDANNNGIISSDEYAKSAIGVLKREALRLIRGGQSVTPSNFLSSANTSVSDIQAQAERFRQNAPSLYSGTIQQLSLDDAQRIADAAVSLRASVHDAGIFDRITAGVELSMANSDSSDRYHQARRRCESRR